MVPKPGPTLLILVITPLKEVIKSFPLITKIRVDITIMRINKVKNPIMLEIVLAGTTFLLYLTVVMALG